VGRLAAAVAAADEAVIKPVAAEAGIEAGVTTAGPSEIGRGMMAAADRATAADAAVPMAADAAVPMAADAAVPMAVDAGPAAATLGRAAVPVAGLALATDGAEDPAADEAVSAPVGAQAAASDRAEAALDRVAGRAAGLGPAAAPAGVASGRVAVAASQEAALAVVLDPAVAAASQEAALAVVLDPAVAAASLAADLAVVLDPAVAAASLAAAVRVQAAEDFVVAGRQANRRRRQGVTLLELILAMSLSILVLMAISLAINLHFRALDVRRTNVEEAQVARQALKRIADDLRSVVVHTPPDLSGLEAIVSSTAAQGASALTSALGQQLTGGAPSGSSGGGQTGGGQTGGGQGAPSGGTPPTTGPQPGQSGGGTGGGMAVGGGASGGLSGGATSAAGSGVSAGGASGQTTGASAAGETTAAADANIVGLYGTNIELRIDVSRLPRVDEYEGILSSDGSLSVVDIPSDVKTVTYFILDAEASEAAKAIGAPQGAIKPSATGSGKGLMRSEISRAVAAYAQSTGDLESTYQNARMLADEVVAVQFQYFDGTAWLTEWDSSASGGLPKAVEIVLTLMPTYAMNEEALANLPPDAPPPEKYYRLVVGLPSAPLVVPAATSEEGATDATGSAAATGAAAGAAATSGAAQGVAP
jgi:type II secretory pathway pseudopilin PulG